MSLFVFNPFRVGEELTPHQLRQNKMMAWQRVLLRPVKYLADLFIDKYCGGTNYAYYDSGTAYVKGDRVVWEDLSVYEAKTSTTGVNPTGNTLSTTNWRKILENHIGVDERARYNGQLIVFEYAINRHFRVTAAPYIYVSEIVPGAAQIFAEVNVPMAVYTALGPNNTARNARITEFATKYLLAGWQCTIVGY